MAHLVITLIGHDRPGLVDCVSAAVADHGGNWLDSRMAHLAGKFAGVLSVEVADERVRALEAALAGLEGAGLHLTVERSAPEAPVGGRRSMEIDLEGLDRPGIVREITSLLAAHQVNVEELSTDRGAAAHSGDSMFHARLRVLIPDAVDDAAVRRGLERLAGDLMVEIRLAEALAGAR